jgi:G3E family GTPase
MQLKRKRRKDYFYRNKILINDDMSLVPVHIVSGFLGSGKTTFLKEIIKQTSASVRLGIIQNEFAPANIDGQEIKCLPGNYRLLEINNGSVFCVCLLGEFVQSLPTFMDDHSPDLLVLEASGLSDTTSLAEIFSHPLLKGRIYFAANWCIVDALNFHRTSKMVQRVIHQVQMADTILLNKTDLAGTLVSDIINELTDINPFAEIIPTVRCNVSFNPEKYHVPGKQTIPLDSPQRPALNAMVIRTSRIISAEQLSEFLKSWAPRAFRIKGTVVTGARSMVSVQCTCGQIEMMPADFREGATELIAITDQFTLREWNLSFKNFC